MVSSYRMTPLMNSSTPGVVKSMSRYARRVSSVDSRPIESKRFLIVPVLSSAARIPLPSATSAFAVSCSSLLAIAVFSRSDSVPNGIASPRGANPCFHGTGVRGPEARTCGARIRPQRGSSSVGRALASQARCRGFESRLPLLASAPRPGVHELPAGGDEMLRNDADVCDHRHEVRVAAPARDDVEMAVVDDAGAGDAAHVPAEVEALGPVGRPQRLEAVRGEPVHLERLVVGEPAEVGAVPVGRDEKVSRRVRELVQEDEGTLAAMDDELLLVVALRGAAEDATLDLVGGLDVLQPPRSP